jgi:hypothetical protein
MPAVLTTNTHDHTIGHCRAQRHTLYSSHTEHCCEVQESHQQQHGGKAAVAKPLCGADEPWTESREELARWGIVEASETAALDTSPMVTTTTTTTAPTTPSEVVEEETDGCLRIEDVAKFWQ